MESFDPFTIFFQTLRPLFRVYELHRTRCDVFLLLLTSCETNAEMVSFVDHHRDADLADGCGHFHCGILHVLPLLWW